MTEVTAEQATPDKDPLAPGTQAQPLGMSEQIKLRQAQQKTNTVLWGIFFLLLVLVGAVIFVLPDYVQPAAPGVAARTDAPPAPAAAPPSPGISPFEEAQRLHERETAQNTLAALLELQTALEQKQVQSWSATSFNAALELARSGDEAYATQQFVEANDLYQSSLTMLQQIESSEAAVYAEYMTQGETAYTAGDAEAASAAYSLALLVNPDSSEAVTGMERAQVLTQVMDLLKQGDELQANNQLEEAREAYQQALAIDSAHAGAIAAVSAINTAIVERNFAAAMSRGYAALQDNDPSRALSAFEQAQAIRPGAEEVKSAIQQANDQQTFAAVSVHINAATRHETNEDWSQALAEWEQALSVDPNLVTAQEGRSRSNSRNNLDVFLTATIKDPLILAEDAVFDKTAQVLADAQQLANPGPKLQGQIKQIQGFLERVRIPVNVQLQSDGLTQVTLYRTGELGAFTSHNVNLTPGNYTAVGVRPGYRDVRQEFVVAIDGHAPVVTIACNEAI
jgi:tetratricopeptide (TPR) repeat protein